MGEYSGHTLLSRWFSNSLGRNICSANGATEPIAWASGLAERPWAAAARSRKLGRSQKAGRSSRLRRKAASASNALNTMSIAAPSVSVSSGPGATW